MRTRNFTGGQLIALGVVAIALAGIGWTVSAWILQVLWNWLVPQVFGGPVITYWQSFVAIALLSFIGSFFKGSSK